MSKRIRPILPTLEIVVALPHIRTCPTIKVVIPNHTQPMDLYNALSREGHTPLSHNNGWLFDDGSYRGPDVAAQFMLERDLVDRKYDCVPPHIYNGAWKA